MSIYSLVDTGLVPDAAIRMGIRRLLRRRLSELDQPDIDQEQKQLSDLVEQLRRSPIALHTETANQQHYEVPTEFFARVLGQHMKYSAGLWTDGVEPGLEHTLLDQSEAAMLNLTRERAEIAGGQEILDLGCGWGSLSLWVAARYPTCLVTGLSNSATQKAYIESVARARGLTNLKVITADIATFESTRQYDRVLSVEMFEHMRNYDALLAKVSRMLKPGGKLFVHIFSHARHAYPFEVRDDSDWMARYFFTGGLMPSADLLFYFPEHLQVERHWRVSGFHYARTCAAWRQNMDLQRSQIMPILEQTYGAGQARRWWTYWRIFFMACEELFAFRHGREWFVSHYLFSQNRARHAGRDE